MLSVKTNPVGIDYYIQRLQKKLHTLLISVDYWNLADATKYESYGRVYRNKTDNGYTAEVYLGSATSGGKEYKEVYWNDTLTAISFFGISGSDVSGEGNNEVDVHFVMFANLSTLALTDKDGNTITHRSDEELRKMITNIIGKSMLGFNYVSTETGIENVLKEYTGSRRDDRLKFVDMHPVHCFRINLKLIYNPYKN